MRPRRNLPPPARRYLTDEELRACDLTATDEIRVYQDPTLRIMQAFGIVVMARDANGTLECDWISSQCLYCLLILSTHFYFLYVAAAERYYLMTHTTDRSFDEDLFLYSLYAFFIFEILPIAFIFESKKIIAHYNQLAVFQARYYHVKGLPIGLNLRSAFKYTIPAFGAISFTILFAANVVNIRSVYKKLDANVMRPFIENLISVAYIILDIVALHMLWVMNLTLLHILSSVFVKDLKEAFRIGNATLMDGYENLWIDFMYIIKHLGNAYTLSLGFYFVLAILTATFELYLAIKQEHAVLMVYGVGLWLSMIGLLMFTDQLTRKLTEDLRRQLLDVKEGATKTRKQRIIRFFRLMRRFNKDVSLGGFTTLTNGLASSILNAITTYIVILVQFKQGGQS